VELSTHFVGLVERGQQLPSLTTLLSLSRTLSVDLDALLHAAEGAGTAPWEREALAVFGMVPAPFRPAVLAMLRALARVSPGAHRYATPTQAPHAVAEGKRRRHVRRAR
jgi:hypothetical protein